MLTSEEKRELQHLEKIDAGYTEKFRNKMEWTEEEKKEQQKKGATKGICSYS